MENYIKYKGCSNCMRKVLSFIVILFFCMLSVNANQTINDTSLGSNQVESDNALYIDFSKDSTLYIFILLFIMLVVWIMININLINSVILMFFSVILMGNGFNLFISFILMLISIVLITYCVKK